MAPPAAGAGKPVRAAAVALKAVRWDLRWVKCAVLAGVERNVLCLNRTHLFRSIRLRFATQRIADPT